MVNITHKMTGTSTYQAWESMKNRCYCKSKKRYKDYGARGIAVCKEWVNSFETFLSDMGERPKGLSLDRINNDKNYSKENCQWATRKQQSSNRRNSKLIKWKKRVYCLAELARLHRIDRGTLNSRLVDGWSLHHALTQPVRFRRKTITIGVK